MVFYNHSPDGRQSDSFTQSLKHSRDKRRQPNKPPPASLDVTNCPYSHFLNMSFEMMMINDDDDDDEAAVMGNCCALLFAP